MELSEREKAFNRFADWWISRNAEDKEFMEAENNYFRAVLAAGWNAGIEWQQEQDS